MSATKEGERKEKREVERQKQENKQKLKYWGFVDKIHSQRNLLYRRV